MGNLYAGASGYSFKEWQGIFYPEKCKAEEMLPFYSQRLGTVEFAKHVSDLACPTCEQTMHAFNYRAYNLELDACSEGHGFWLDDGEAVRVREIMKERVRGLSRAAGAQTAWVRAKGGPGGGVLGQIKGLFGGRR